MTINDTTIQERPSSASVERNGSFPEFDPAKYRAELSEFGLTEEQENELLTILWSIMVKFVYLGFDVKNCGQIFESFTQAAQGDSGAIDSSHSSQKEKPIGGRSHD
ncbi:hypothetical protein DEM25_001315 [Oceaniradius stylonematis]|uniref:Uncharacterized protein n=1 Tax=Oceaniradius stylonematis TaxID=2184161 RepID=A0A3A8AH09_9HYPH|nr:hypothetical protein [Oceaniradius stylonematis]RKF08648.1 hypothetical protein DEM25_001315 [Oceaniradius stylonematis]